MRTRSSQWRQYSLFCKKCGLEPLPTTLETICRFIAYIAPGTQFFTVQNYVAGLPSVHNLHNLSAPHLTHFWIRQMLSWLKRQRNDRPNRKLSITPQILLAIHTKLRFVSRRFRPQLWSACLFGFFWLIRKSNLLQNRYGKKYLTLCDVATTSIGLTLGGTALKTLGFLAHRI